MSSLPQTFYVYVLVRPKDRVFYVGKGKGDRIYDHETEARSGHVCHKCRVIRKVWRQGEQIQRYILFTTVNEVEALAYEVETIALYGRKNLTNLTDGGEGTSNPPPETRAKLSAARRAQWADPEIRARMSAAQKARFARPEERAKYRATSKAQVLSPETRANMLAASKRTRTAETRAKMSAAMSGRVISAETKAKQRAVRLAYWAQRKAAQSEDTP